MGVGGVGIRIGLYGVDGQPVRLDLSDERHCMHHPDANQSVLEHHPVVGLVFGLFFLNFLVAVVRVVMVMVMVCARLPRSSVVIRALAAAGRGAGTGGRQNGNALPDSPYVTRHLATCRLTSANSPDAPTQRVPTAAQVAVAELGWRR